MDSIFVVNWSNKRWNDLFQPSTFKWVENETPFSESIWQYSGTIIYSFFLFGIWSYMKNREAMNLKFLSTVHNLILTIWSTIMTIGILVEVIRKIIMAGGLEGALCEKDPSPLHGWFGYWCYIYHLSKYYELLDTIIIALRKKPIIFLHVYHHVCMVYLTRLWMNDGLSLQWGTVFLNSFVHIFMYYFYFKASLGQSVWWKVYITRLQLVQFAIFLGILGSYSFYYETVSFSSETMTITTTNNCSGSKWLILLNFFFDLTLIMLFSNFYGKTYSGSEKNGSRSQKE